MDPKFQLRCLGEPTLVGPDGQPIRFKVRKHLALLVYLAVESKSRHRREHLAELLWPNLPEVDGRHSLATALTMLRARFGRDVVESGRDDLRWAHTRLDLDLDRLAAGNVLGDEFTAPLNVAGFLDGFEVPGAGEFMLWRERQRARWLPHVRDALVVLMDRCRRTGDSRQIEQLADRMLVLDDLSEDAIRGKMEARAFAGDRLGALKIFEAWKERLDEELGAAPSAMLEGMALRLRRRGWERSGSSRIPSVRTDQWKNRPFVGRVTEYRALYEGWERTQRGAPGHALVLGESGIGKSTLVERLTTAASLEGASVSRVQCYELEREIPYAVVCGLVHGLLDQPGVSAASPEALAELGRTVPQVRKRFPNLPVPFESEGETARIRLAEALHELVLSVAEEHPVILVVDDHHLADDASLAVLHLLMRRAESQPILVILVARPSEMGRSPQAARLKEGLPRLGALSIELPPLTEAECEELLGSFIPSDRQQPNGAARRALVRAASGFPMILELLCQDWLTNGEQSLALSMDAMTTDPAGPGAPTEAFRQLYDRIVQSLDPVTRSVLNLASILHHRLNDVTMYTLADLTVGQTMLGMSQLTALRVLRDGGNGVEFINELIRAHAYMSVPLSVRRVLHGSIADRLIQEEQQGGEVQGLEVAWHCIRSGRVAEAAPYLLKGARQAIQRGAPQEAERGLSTGLPILHGVDQSEGTMILVEAYQEQEMWIDSLTVLESSGEALTSRHHDRLYPLQIYAQHHLGMIGPDNAESILEGLEQIGTTATPIGLRVTALRMASRLVYLERLAGAAPRLISLALSLRGMSLDSEESLGIQYALGILYGHIGDRESSLSELTSATQAIRTTGIANALAQAITINLGAALCAAGQYEAALEQFTIAQGMSRRLGADDAFALIAANKALCCGRLGQYNKQIEWATVASTLLGNRFAGYRNVQIATALGRGYAMSGRPDEAMGAIEALDQSMPQGSPAWLRQAWYLAKADILWLCGKKSAADAEAVKGVTSQHEALSARSLAGSYARWLAIASRKELIEGAHERVNKLAHELTIFDIVDQVEILGAKLLLNDRTAGKRNPNSSSGYHDRLLLAQQVARLPPATGEQLVLLGLPLAGA